MPTYLIDLSPDDMRRRLPDALRVYVDAMRYPRGTEVQRAALWLEHTARADWRAVAAVAHPHRTDPGEPPPATGELLSAPLVGIAYGYGGAPEQWWHQQVTVGLHRLGTAPTDIAALMTNYFELTELHVDPRAQGHGLGEALTRRLLSRCAHSSVLLSTPEVSGEDNRAWRLYRRLGFTDVIRGYHFAGDPRPFAVLARTLPL